MGREVRRVPPTWQHPIAYTKRGPRHIPLHEGPVEADIARWERDAALFAQGKTDEGEPLPPAAAGLSFEEWHMSRPDPADYMPSWPDAERTHYQMYETCSEGTPISPIFATPEELARWLADNGASAFGDMTASYEWWLNVARGSSSVGMMMRARGDGTVTTEPV